MDNLAELCPFHNGTAVPMDTPGPPTGGRIGMPKNRR